MGTRGSSPSRTETGWRESIWRSLFSCGRAGKPKDPRSPLPPSPERLGRVTYCFEDQPEAYKAAKQVPAYPSGPPHDNHRDNTGFGAVDSLPAPSQPDPMREALLQGRNAIHPRLGARSRYLEALEDSDSDSDEESLQDRTTEIYDIAYGVTAKVIEEVKKLHDHLESTLNADSAASPEQREQTKPFPDPLEPYQPSGPSYLQQAMPRRKRDNRRPPDQGPPPKEGV